MVDFLMWPFYTTDQNPSTLERFGWVVYLIVRKILEYWQYVINFLLSVYHYLNLCLTLYHFNLINFLVSSTSNFNST